MKADDNGMTVASQALKEKAIELLGIGLQFKNFLWVSFIIEFPFNQRYVHAYEKPRVHEMVIRKTLKGVPLNI